MKRAISNLAFALTPPLLWNTYLRVRGRRQHFPYRECGFMATTANTKPLYEGRFAELYAKYAALDPFHDPEATRYSFYNVCLFANLCRLVPGDFLCGGISWGVAARLLYDFVEFGRLGKTLHLVDPFDARTSNTNRRTTQLYNSDPEFVRRQYPPGAPVAIHCEPIPPSHLPDQLAFIFLNTGDPKSDAEALASFYASLSSGGCILLNNYANNIEDYAPAVSQLGVTPLWLPSAQGVIFKGH
jgi:hypothetical protein